MYFVAFLLTLSPHGGKTLSSYAETRALCAALKDFLSQQCRPDPHDFIRVAFFAQHNEQTTFRITLGERIQVNGMPRVLEALLSSSTVLLSHHLYDVESLDLTDSTWSGMSTWDDIMETSGSLIRFSFASPLVTVKPERGRAYEAGPFPELAPLFSQVRQYWDVLEGPALPQDVEEIVQFSGYVESNYRLHTVSIDVGGRFHTGYLGWIEYESRIRRTVALAPLNALARLAFFTGLGEHTEHGMGATAVTIA